jgi:hypothetical protein
MTIIATGAASFGHSGFGAGLSLFAQSLFDW